MMWANDVRRGMVRRDTARCVPSPCTPYHGTMDIAASLHHRPTVIIAYNEWRHIRDEIFHHIRLRNILCLPTMQSLSARDRMA